MIYKTIEGKREALFTLTPVVKKLYFELDLERKGVIIDV